MNLAFASFIGNTNLVNEEIEMIAKTDKQKLLASANEVLTHGNSSTLYYRSAK